MKQLFIINLIFLAAVTIMILKALAHANETLVGPCEPIGQGCEIHYQKQVEVSPIEQDGNESNQLERIRNQIGVR